ncbi:MAG: hypothetical protein WKG07_07625 [Hymenobacter sp.]
MLVSTALVLLMAPGLAFFYGGMVNRGNIISTMLQSFISLGVISLLWYVVGFSLAFGDDIGGVIGDPRTFFMFNNVGTAPHPHAGGGAAAGAVRGVSTQICHHYPGAYHRRLCRAHSVLGLPHFYLSL